MKIYRSIILGSLLVAGGLSSCSNDEGTRPGRYDGVVTFDATVPAETRVTGITWDAGDQIGVYMDHATDPAENKRYTTGGNGTFTPASFSADGIKFPESGTADFTAYYPYRADVNPDKTIPVTVTDQGANLDYMYATKDNVANGDAPVALVFDRVMTKITFNITDEAGVDLSNLVVNLKGLATAGLLDLADGEVTGDMSTADVDIKAVTTAGTSTATATAIIIPTTGTTGFSVNFKNSNLDEESLFDDGTAFVAGSHYSYKVTIKADGRITISGSINSWTDVNGGDIDINVGDGGGGEGGVIFKETFGNGDYPSGNRPKIAEFTDWDEKGVTYTDASGRTDIRSTNAISPHAWFPATGEAYLTISGINTAGYDDISLSFDLAANVYNAGEETDLNVMQVSFNGTNYPINSIPVSNANGDRDKYYTITLDGLPAVSNGVLEFSTNDTNTRGLRLDNITITAGDGGDNPPPGDGDYYEAGTLASWDFDTYGWSNAASTYDKDTPIYSSGTANLLGQTAYVTAEGGSENGKVAYGYTAASSYSAIITKGWVSTALEDHSWMFHLPLTKDIEAGSEISVTFAVYASSTAAANYVCEVSLDKTSWTNIGTYSISAANTVTQVTSLNKYTAGADIPAGNTLYVRMRANDNQNVSNNGTAFSTTGTTRIGDVIFTLE